jgi:hypothetical protein
MLVVVVTRVAVIAHHKRLRNAFELTVLAPMLAPH